jgi:ABC-type nitrate/sulfonate/bicarbonate transport system ATPase subunit
MRVVVERVSKTFVDWRGRQVVALRQVDLAVESQEFVALLGPSGCGKSTLLNIIAGLLPATSGQVYFEAPRGLPDFLVLRTQPGPDHHSGYYPAPLARTRDGPP